MKALRGVRRTTVTLIARKRLEWNQEVENAKRYAYAVHRFGSSCDPGAIKDAPLRVFETGPGHVLSFGSTVSRDCQKISSSFEGWRRYGLCCRRDGRE